MEEYGHCISRSKVIKEAVYNMIREMYFRAQPPIDFKFYEEAYKNRILDAKKDHYYDWHYLPEKVQTQIVDDYLEAYGANDQFKKWCKFLMENFKEGGHRTVYKDIFGDGKPTRTGEETEKLDELIGEENAEKVYKLMEDFMEFYRTDMDEMSIRCGIFHCPTSNPKSVIEKWGDSVTIDDSVYKGYDGEMWDYTYKDYYKGEITGIDEDELWDNDQNETEEEDDPDYTNEQEPVNDNAE